MSIEYLPIDRPFSKTKVSLHMAISVTTTPAKPRREPDPSRGRGRPTLREVARLSGMSPSTVSAILNNREYCWAAKSSRQKVIEAAKALGYRPNLAARALRGGQT